MIGLGRAMLMAIGDLRHLINGFISIVALLREWDDISSDLIGHRVVSCHEMDFYVTLISRFVISPWRMSLQVVNGCDRAIELAG